MNIDLKDLIQFIKNKNLLLKYKIDRYIKKKEKENKIYRSIKSNKQIKTIYNYRHEKPKYYFSLLLLLNDFYKIKDFTGMENLYKIIDTSKSDKEIYFSLNKNIKGGNRRVHMIEELLSHKIKKYILKTGYKIDYFLDIGCGSGKKAYLLGQYLNLKDKYVHCADIKQWFSLEKNREKNIKNFGLIENDILPYNDNKFSLISSFMVLHHVKNLSKLLKEIHRVLKRGGYLFITEHDAMTDFDKMLIDIQHAIYELVYRNNKSFFNEYYGKYYDVFQWHYILHLHNFKLIKYNYYTTKTRKEIGSTRYFYAIYKKI
jgi:ubiquinone/menaquinone biosynthesis C-methylase UbiE